MVSPSPLLVHLSDAERAEVESWLVEFDLRWDTERLPVRVRQLPADGPLRLSALTEMVKIDIERQWQQGHRVVIEDYLRTFPELGPQDGPPLDLVEAESRPAFIGDRPGEAELCDRFPRCGEAIRRLLGVIDTAPQGNFRTSAPADGASTLSLPDREARDLSEQFGRYRIRTLLGHGGMGTVYLADDTQLDRVVALKVPHFSRSGDPDARERFRREGRAAAALDHPHLCRVYDVGEHDGIPYLTMAYVEGRPLGDPADGPLSIERVVGVVRKVALALAYAHARGVVHRDLKPSNILIDGRGEPVVTDFGLAQREGSGDPRLSRDGVPIGTPAYMSPEQVAGAPKAIGPATDIFSLSVVLYELLTGRLPFRGGAAEVMGRILTETPLPPSTVRPGIDSRLDAACLKAMAKDSADRFASMEEFAAALPPDRPAAPQRRFRALVSVGSLALFATIMVIIVRGALSGPDHPGQPDQSPSGTPSQTAAPEMAPAPRPAKPAAPTVFRGHDKAVVSVAFAADGRRLLSADEHTIRLWDPEAEKEVVIGRQDLRGRTLDEFVFSPDGRQFVGHFLQSIELYDVANLKELAHTRDGGPHTGMKAFAANGKRIVIAKMASTGEASALVWDLESNAPFWFTKHPALEAIQAVALSADGKQGVSAAKDGVRVGGGGGREQRHRALHGAGFHHGWPDDPDGKLARLAGAARSEVWHRGRTVRGAHRSDHGYGHFAGWRTAAQWKRRRHRAALVDEDAGGAPAARRTRRRGSERGTLCRWRAGVDRWERWRFAALAPSFREALRSGAICPSPTRLLDV